jgi:hypothetical protein
LLWIPRPIAAKPGPGREEETVSAEPVPSFVLTLRLSLMGREVKSYTFGKPEITIGRDPEADVFIDNPGISREHLRIERTATGAYEAVDLGSANGSFFNDEPLAGRMPLRDGDRIRVGKFTLTAGYDSDRRETMTHAPIPAADADQSTMVLTKDDLAKVLELQRKAEVTPPIPPPAVAKALGKDGSESAGLVPKRVAIIAAIVGYAIGAITGATIAMYLAH